MEIAIYNYDHDEPLIRSALERYWTERCRLERFWPDREKVPVFRFYRDYDSFLRGLMERPCTRVLVARKGTDGLEGAKAACDLRHNASLVWFSDNEEYSLQANRLGCTCFTAEAMTEEGLLRAMEQCDAQRVG